MIDVPAPGDPPRVPLPTESADFEPPFLDQHQAMGWEVLEACAQDPARTEREGFLQVPGGRVWYRAVGDGPGTPLLVLHGGPGFPHDYLEGLAALGDQRRVIFYDQLGCGRSDRPEDPSLWTLERFVEELAAVRAALRLDQVHLLGQSWGTMLAVEYMLTKRPAGVRSLVLSGPCLSARRWEADQATWLARMSAEVQEGARSTDFEGPAFQEAVQAFYREHVCRLEPWPESLERSMAGLGMPIYLQMWGPSEFVATGSLRDFERVERLAGIATPTLFTCGEYDEATPATTAFYHQRMPGSELAVLPDASHEHHLEQPERYLRLVRDFLQRAERR